MNPILADLEATQGDRYRCPLCDARRGLSVDPDEGETGVWHCFSCQEGGTGAELYAELHHVGIAEALDAYGISGSDKRQQFKRKESKAPRPTVPDKSDAEKREQYRVWSRMTEAELYLRDAYRDRRAAAQVARDRDEFDRWQQKLDDLFAVAAERITQKQRTVDRADTPSLPNTLLDR